MAAGTDHSQHGMKLVQQRGGNGAGAGQGGRIGAGEDQHAVGGGLGGEGIKDVVGVSLAAAGFLVAAAALVRFTEPRGRPGPRRLGVAVALAEEADPRTLAKAEAAASRRVNSSTKGFSSFRRSVISRRLSSRKSVTISPSSLV